jgi:hypothetical protein
MNGLASGRRLWLRALGWMFCAGAMLQAAEPVAPIESSAPAETLSPAVELKTVFPNPPGERAVMEKGVLLKDTPYFWGAPAGRRAQATPYRPLADGFTRVVPELEIPAPEDRRNHRLAFENNQVVVPQRPRLTLLLNAFSAMYGNHDTFPITGVGMKEALPKGTATLGLGTLRLAVEVDGRRAWVDQFEHVEVTYRAGYAGWLCRDEGLGIELRLEARPNVAARGFILRIETLRAPERARLLSHFGGIGFYGNPPGNSANGVDLSHPTAKITSPDLPRAQVLFGLVPAADARDKVPAAALDTTRGTTETMRAVTSSDPVQPLAAQLASPLKVGAVQHAIAVWGVDGYDETIAEVVKRRMKPQALAEPNLSRLWQVWFDNFIGKQLEPEPKYAALAADPAAAWAQADAFWTERQRRWSVQTPDAALNATTSWAGPTLEYFRQPPGYMLGYISWQGYGHITSGFFPLAPLGDLDQMATHLETLAATRLNADDDGSAVPIDSALSNDKELRWTFLNLETVVSEPLNMAYLDHVWTWWQWSGDKARLAALWPAFEDAIEGEMRNRDKDGDGLYHGFYEFWDCDAEQRGPKGAAQTAWMISGLRAGAKMATALGKTELAARYAAEAERSQAAFNAQLWYPEIGQCGARTADDQRYERASIHEVFIPAQRGVLDAFQAVQALRRLKYLYSQTSDFGKPLMFKNDVWPILWSQHYMPPGDISLLYMAAAKNGLADEFYPYYEMVSHAALESTHAGLSLAVGQDGVISTIENGNSDAHAPYAWALAEGLFGIAPDGEPGKVKIAPNFPADWPSAKATIGDVTVEMERDRENYSVTLRIHDKQGRALRLLWPTISGVSAVDWLSAKGEQKLLPAINRTLLELSVPAGQAMEVKLHFAPDVLRLDQDTAEWVTGELQMQKVFGGKAVEIKDPQGCLASSQILANGKEQYVQYVPKAEGYHTFFVRLEGTELNAGLSYWRPVSFNAGPRWVIDQEFAAADPPRTAPIRQVSPQLLPAEKRIVTRVKNRSSIGWSGDFSLTVAGETTRYKGLHFQGNETRELSAVISEKAWASLLPGTIPFSVTASGLESPVQAVKLPRTQAISGDGTQQGKVHAWPTPAQPKNPAPPARERLVQLDLDAARNLTPGQMEKVPMPLDFGGMNTLLGWYNTSYKMEKLPQEYEPLPGLPFRLSAQADTDAGEPMLVLAHAGSTTSSLPTQATLPIGRPVERVYLFAMFHYYAIKAYSPQAEVLLEYADGTRASHPLTPPFSVDCLLRPESPQTFAVNVGESTNPGWNVPHYFLGPIHAQVIDIPTDATKTLKSMTLSQTSTESYMGVLGITLVKPEG